MEIQTARLIIRNIEMKDAISILEAMECPEVHQMHNNGFTSIEKVQNYIEVLLNEYNSLKFRTLAIAERSTNKLIGIITLDVMSVFSRAEYCYWVNKKYRNIGYATETIKAKNEYCFKSLAVNRIQAMTSNTASEKVLKKSGMIYEGTLRQYFGIDGDYWDVKMYSILRRDLTEITEKARS